jgi:hypothetical protein
LLSASGPDVFAFGFDGHRGRAAQGFVAPRRQPLQPFGLGQQHAAQAALDLALGDDLGEPREDQRSACDPEVRMRPELMDALRNDPPP